MENHIHRPEVQLAIQNKFGTSIRKSATTGQEYYYYAHFYNDYLSALAAIYNIEIKTFYEQNISFCCLLP